MLTETQRLKSQKVLIDTWWNVNECILEGYYKAPSFNRYMVECK